jgi:hypothetical protein
MIDGNWIPVKDGDERAFALFSRHYSYQPYKDNRRQMGYRNRFLICGPGGKLVMITQDCNALFVWRKFKDENQPGINCAVFRNESGLLASELILEAEQLALAKWPDTNRFYTYINPKKVRPIKQRGKELWGYCFLKAGWQQCDYVTKWNKHLVFEKWITEREEVNPSPIELGSH